MDAVPTSATAQPVAGLPSWPPPTGQRPARVGRIHGIDLARGLAMLGMVIVHYVWAHSDTGFGAEVARAMEGRAMPLFMLLGGVGVVLLSSRSSTPDRGLIIRAAILLVIGLILDAVNDRIAVVLQFYGLLFLVSPLLRRLSSTVLAVAAVASVAIGGVTYQTVGDAPRRSSFEAIGEGWPFLRSLLFDGYYPFFPIFAFFALGMVLARLDLRDQRVAALIAGVGTVVGLGTLVAANALTDALAINPGAFANGTFSADRLLDVSGHSSMPAWVISAAGTSAAVLGFSLLAARAAPAVTRPVAILGTVALSFYVFQVLTTLVITSPNETSLGREWLTVAILYGGFLVAAVVWKQWFRSGPLEALLRVGTPRRRP
ncbi:MAG: heparan-alpha-glucosaminide N-acetyltransferase domain-containing protein [Actinomycetota bacterium]